MPCNRMKLFILHILLSLFYKLSLFVPAKCQILSTLNMSTEKNKKSLIAEQEIF